MSSISNSQAISLLKLKRHELEGAMDRLQEKVSGKMTLIEKRIGACTKKILEVTIKTEATASYWLSNLSCITASITTAPTGIKYHKALIAALSELNTDRS